MSLSLMPMEDPRSDCLGAAPWVQGLMVFNSITFTFRIGIFSF